MKKYILLTCLVFIISCKANIENKQKDIQQLPASPTTVVKTKLLEESIFYYDILSNGKLSVSQKINLYFQNSNEPIININVKNGQKVSKGQLMAEQDKFKLETTLKQSKIQLEQTHIELQDLLIARGLDLSDSLNIPQQIMKTTLIRSGHEKADIDYKLALYNYKSATLYAPFDGIIANLYTTEGNLPTAGEPFCTVLDNKQLNVDFTILENELGIVQSGDKVIIEAFTAGGTQAEGVISEINPVVEKNGLVKIKASVNNNKSSLFDGMNVKVKIRKVLNKKLVIPKSALVLRDNKQVVFSVKNNKAIWHYVTTELENSDSYTIRIDNESTLLSGENIIIDGNINLAHETPVEVNNDSK